MSHHSDGVNMEKEISDGDFGEFAVKVLASSSSSTSPKVPPHVVPESGVQRATTHELDICRRDGSCLGRHPSDAILGDKS